MKSAYDKIAAGLRDAIAQALRQQFKPTVDEGIKPEEQRLLDKLQ